MVKRRDVVRLLEKNGFKNIGGAKHDVFTKGRFVATVPRHREISDYTFDAIMKQAGLK